MLFRDCDAVCVTVLPPAVCYNSIFSPVARQALLNLRSGRLHAVQTCLTCLIIAWDRHSCTRGDYILRCRTLDFNPDNSVMTKRAPYSLSVKEFSVNILQLNSLQRNILLETPSSSSLLDCLKVVQPVVRPS